MVKEKIWEEFKIDFEYMDDYLEFIRVLENLIWIVELDKRKRICLIILFGFIKICIKFYGGVKNFKEVIEKNDVYKNNVFYDCGKFVLNSDFFRGFFKKIIDGIVKDMDEIL